jgi:hypothetical protein
VSRLPTSDLWRCCSCRRRRCPGYAPTWARDQRRKLFANLGAFEGRSARVLMLTITPPGADVLPWDLAWCSARGPHRCSGKHGCRVKPISASGWNVTAAQRWRRLHRRAYQDTICRFGRGSLLLLARVWELQKRGVLHVHPVLGYATPRQRAAAIHYRARIEALSEKYGFGFVSQQAKAMETSAAAAYLSSYFVAGKGRKLSLHESVTSPAMPRSIIHVSPRLTESTGITMRELRFRRFVWVVARRLRVDLPTARLIAELARSGGFAAIEAPSRLE